jgi:YidC/Oxa1 family membrane protein insertase
MLSAFYDAVFYRPIFNLLIWLVDVVPGHDIGIAIVLLTVIVKSAMWPLQASTLRSQKALADLQPKVAELKAKFPGKENEEALAKEMMALYSREKVNPAASCLPLFIQLPVFIALYHSLSAGLKSGGLEKLYSFVANPGTIAPQFLGLVDLAVPSIVLALLAGATQYVQAKMMVTRQQPKNTPGAKDEQMLAVMNKQMVYMMPALTTFLGFTLPGGLSLYWLAMNVFSIAQQHFFFKKHEPVKP